jgi:1-acyl-sn-glycerol-3-phosphate acyltransferase
VAEPVYSPVIAVAKLAFKALGMTVTVTGAEHVPRSGGAVLAINHVSYLDFIFAGFAALRSGRYTRFMAKESVFTHRLSGPLMRGMKHIPVDRDAGSGSFRTAMRALKSGEVVGIFPEATTSRSFVVKDLKSGAVRLAQATGTPLVPVAVWGGQRMFTKGGKRQLTRRHGHVYISVGEPIPTPKGANGEEITQHLRTVLQTMLDDLQARTPEQPAPGESPWWHPAHLGGSAPTLEAAAVLEEAERAEKAAKRAARAAAKAARKQGPASG